MKHLIKLVLIILLAFFAKTISAQDVLPEFKLKLISPGKVTISWHNPFRNCVQLSVQRSNDNKKFKTIISAKNPSLYENSFTDTKSPKNKNSFYRIQYIIKGGKYNLSNTHNIFEKTEVKVNNENTNGFVLSPFVFTNKTGYIQIQLTNVSKFTYRLIFHDEKGTEIFQMKKIVSDNLILDKTNFPHIGWFYFELYKDEILFEKNKVFLKGN
jgi:hypothetical protein